MPESDQAWRRPQYSSATRRCQSTERSCQVAAHIVSGLYVSGRILSNVAGDDLWRYARICRVANVMKPYMEAVV